MHAWMNVLAFYLGEAASDPINLAVLAQYGVLGLGAGALAIFAKVSYKRETERSDRLEAEVIRLNNLIIDRAIPALTSAANAAEGATELLRDMQREREINMMRNPPGGPRRQRPGGEDGS